MKKFDLSIFFELISDIFMGRTTITMINIVVRRVFFISVFACWASIACAEMLQGKVVAVSDGDTVTVLDSDHSQHKIRLMGIDAPEKAQAYGQRSKQHLSSLVFGKDVLIEWHKRDRYQRIVGRVLVAQPGCSPCDMTIDAGLEQIRSGLAWWYRQYAKEQAPEDRKLYETAEMQARESQVGLWRDPDPVPPWDYRHKR